LKRALGLLETTGLTPAMVALDAMEKTAGIRVCQIELNDMCGVCLKIEGDTSDVMAAVAAGRVVAENMAGNPVTDIITHPDTGTWTAVQSPPEFNPLIQQGVVLAPNNWQNDQNKLGEEKDNMSEQPFALGFIETQGFTAVFEAIDSACKAASVEVIGKEKLGGGFITVIIQGEVAAVQEAVHVGRLKVEGLGKLIAAHVIPRPSAGVLSLLPKI
jgi:carbon dioxide concentrating mechanism protein CcmO